MLSKGVSNWACYLVTHKYAWSVCINLREKPSLSLETRPFRILGRGQRAQAPISTLGRLGSSAWVNNSRSSPQSSPDWRGCIRFTRR